MAPKFMVILFFGLLLVLSMEPIEFRESADDSQGLATVETYVQVTDLFHHTKPLDHVEKDDLSKTFCPAGYKLCQIEDNKSSHLYDSCVETQKSKTRVQRETLYDGSITYDDYFECKEVNTVNRDNALFKLVLVNKFFKKDVPEVSDLIHCKVVGSKNDNVQSSEVRYFKAVGSQTKLAEQTKSWIDVKLSIDDTEIWYQVICGTTKEIIDAEPPNAQSLSSISGETTKEITSDKILKTERVSTRREKVDVSAPFDLTYYAIICVLVLFMLIAYYCCKNSNKQSEDEIKDVELKDILTESMSETMTHPNDFTISIEDLQQIQKQVRENELSEIAYSISEKSHSKEESSNIVNQQSITDQSIIVSDEETRKPRKTNSNSIFSFSEETTSEVQSEAKQEEKEKKNDPEK